MLKAKIFSTTTMNALTSIKKKKKKNPNQPSIKKKKHFFVLFLSLLVNDCILMYLETTILSIYKFLISYLEFFFFFFTYNLTPANLKSWIHPSQSP